MIDKQIYTPEQCPDIFNFLDTLEVEYHKPYKRFNQIVKVPRGQASYTLDETIHYDYKVSGGSPPNYIMCPQLKEITARVNETLGTNFNTILLNKYKHGDDCIGFHKDRETGWAERGARANGRGGQGLRGAAYLALSPAPRSRCASLLTGCYWMLLVVC
eukprot:COSAG05_NODE_5_length_47078_cov_547.868814_20_plen_159_part_00